MTENIVVILAIVGVNSYQLIVNTTYWRPT